MRARVPYTDRLRCPGAIAFAEAMPHKPASPFTLTLLPVAQPPAPEQGQVGIVRRRRAVGIGFRPSRDEVQRPSIRALDRLDRYSG